ncbi:hypothetical protein J4457_02615 [Candidatus Woesearchaeota archaeon]|nr:hypothetical protein [Candidatus Woesearchaeota archaeon]
MPEISREEIEKVMQNYGKKISAEIDLEAKPKSMRAATASREYQEFKKEILPKQQAYFEQLCNICAKLFKVPPSPKKKESLEESIRIAHLSCTPEGVMSFSYLAPFFIIFIGVIFSLLIIESTFFTLLVLVFGLVLIPIIQKYPHFLANAWRLQSSNQMVVCVFYIVTYMRHTSNLENALQFAADHLAPPLSLDMKKVLWDVETETYESVKESLDMYLESWRKWNMEFIEAMHLIESSLYEPAEERRLELLDKSLEVILEETYEKMLHYAHNLKSPIEMLHMLGIILPVLGLVILPLVVSFMEEVAWYHLAVLYNIIIPLTVYYLGKNILSTRPTGYGDTDISEENPELKKYRNIVFNIAGSEIVLSPKIVACLIILVGLFIAFIPVLLHLADPGFDFSLFGDPETGEPFLGYRSSSKNADVIVGPYGLGATLLSLFFPLSIGLGLGIFYKLRSKNIIKIRENAKRLESEFASALFQLGNRLGDGLPAEIAFSKVADVMEETVSGKFFRLVSDNISKLGMGVEEAIFNTRVGALQSFPSNTIESSMKVLIQSVKKGPRIAAQSLMSIGRYIKEIHTVNERLKDLLADVISSMKSQIKFMAPVISGIVIGITSMITNILGKLSGQLASFAGTEAEAAQIGGVAQIFGDGIPAYYFQIVVGVYVVQMIVILTIMANGIENGADKLNETYEMGNNLVRSTVLYCFVALVIIVLFNMIANQILTKTLS